MNRRPRILPADDHAMLLDAFRRLLEPLCDIVGTATDGRAFLVYSSAYRPEYLYGWFASHNKPRNINRTSTVKRMIKNRICL
jgi:hypothetical protein